MASLRPAFVQLRGRCQASAPQWQQLRQSMQALRISPAAGSKRWISNDDFVRSVESRPNENVASEPPPVFKPKQYSASNDFVAADKNDDGQKQFDGVSNNFVAADRHNDRRFANRQHENGQRGNGQRDNRQYDNGPQAFRLGEGDEIQDIKLDENGRPIIIMPKHARPLPVSPSYFSRQPQFNDSYLELQRLSRKYAGLPSAPADQREKVAFRTIRDYKLNVGEDIKASEYSRCIGLVKQLHKIHPDLQTQEVKDAVAKFKRAVNPYIQISKPIYVDKFGRTVGVGRRKTSTARAWMVEGTGEVLVNGKSLAEAFGRIHDRDSAVWALKATERMDKYNVWALVEGGGKTGQAEALTLAVAKALMSQEPALKPTLRRAGCVTRDRRVVERKKHGHLKARKKPAWVKR